MFKALISKWLLRESPVEHTLPMAVGPSAAPLAHKGTSTPTITSYGDGGEAATWESLDRPETVGMAALRARATLDLGHYDGRWSCRSIAQRIKAGKAYQDWAEGRAAAPGSAGICSDGPSGASLPAPASNTSHLLEVDATVLGGVGATPAGKKALPAKTGRGPPRSPRPTPGAAGPAAAHAGAPELRKQLSAALRDLQAVRLEVEVAQLQRDHARAQLARLCGTQLGAEALAARRASHAEAGTSAAGDSQPRFVSPLEQGAATDAAPSASHVDIVVFGLPLPLGFGPEEAAAGFREFCQSSLGLPAPGFSVLRTGTCRSAHGLTPSSNVRPGTVVVARMEEGTAASIFAAKRRLPRSCLVSIDFDLPREQRLQRQQQRRLGGRALAARPRPPQPPAAAAPLGQTA